MTRDLQTGAYIIPPQEKAATAVITALNSLIDQAKVCVNTLCGQLCGNWLCANYLSGSGQSKRLGCFLFCIKVLIRHLGMIAIKLLPFCA